MDLPKKGGYLVYKGLGQEDIRELNRAFERCEYRLMRDVVIGGPGDSVDMLAHVGDFWFHTDGAFLPVPPAWVVIQILEVEEGGALHLISSDALRPFVPPGQFRFGPSGRGIESQIITEVGNESVFRYRRDYMSSMEEDGALHEFSEQLIATAERHALRLPPLGPGDCLVLDNWRLLHRREAFKGRRVIRRLWFGR